MKVLTLILALVIGFGTTSFASPNHEEKMVTIFLLNNNNNDDEAAVTAIHTTLMAAEKVSHILEVELIAEEEVTDDVFVFSLKSEEQKKLTMKLFDEEGFELAAHRELDVADGNNYNALNVQTLNDGTYQFKLIGEDGAEKSATITINRPEATSEDAIQVKVTDK